MTTGVGVVSVIEGDGVEPFPLPPPNRGVVELPPPNKGPVVLPPLVSITEGVVPPPLSTIVGVGVTLVLPVRTASSA